MDFGKIFSLRNIAVVGFSKDPAKPSHRVPKYLMEQGYNVIPVNPFAGEELLGKTVYKSVQEIPETVDIVVVFRPSREVPNIAADVLKRSDVQVFWLQEGIEHEEAATEVEGRGIIVVQDRCMFKEHKILTNF